MNAYVLGWEFAYIAPLSLIHKFYLDNNSNNTNNSPDDDSNAKWSASKVRRIFRLVNRAVLISIATGIYTINISICIYRY